jgi:hypothetical protein
MTTPREPDRLINAFLDEGRTELPDRSYDAVRAGIDRTRQRVVIGPWREPQMNNLTKFLIAAAAVVVVAVIGVNLLPAGRGGGAGSSGGAPTASAGPTPGPTGFPTEALGIGTHSLIMGGVPLTVSITTPSSEDEGWVRFGGLYIGKDVGVEGQAAEAIIYWTPLLTGADARPCAPLLSLAADSTAADLAAAVASAPGTQVLIGPAAVTIGGRATQRVELRVSQDLGCDPGYFYTWPQGPQGPFWWGTDVGDKINVWIVDVDGTPLLIVGEIHEFPRQGHAGTMADLEREIQQIVDSISFP